MNISTVIKIYFQSSERLFGLNFLSKYPLICLLQYVMLIIRMHISFQSIRSIAIFIEVTKIVYGYKAELYQPFFA